MLVILPFEKDFFQKWNYETEYVGHPLVEVIERFKQSPGRQITRYIYWPGGRSANSDPPVDRPVTRQPKTGNLKKLPVMLEASRSFPEYSVCSGRSAGTGFSFL